MNDRFFSCSKAFVATLRAGSMSAAAADLKTTKSAISQKIAVFEADLGLTLLDRSGRSVKATSAGERIFNICVDSVDAAAQAEAELGLKRGDRVEGRVSLSGPNSLLETIFLPMIEGLQREYPEIELELNADDARSDFSTDDIDLSFRTGERDRGRDVAVSLPVAPRAPFASPKFLHRFDAPSTPSDLSGPPVILRTQEAPVWSFRNSDGVQQDVYPEPAIRVNTMELARAAAKFGTGIAMLPEQLAKSDVSDGTLLRLLPDWSLKPIKVTLICRAQRLSMPAVAAVRRHIIEQFRSQSGS